MADLVISNKTYKNVDYVNLKNSDGTKPTFYDSAQGDRQHPTAKCLCKSGPALALLAPLELGTIAVQTAFSKLVNYYTSSATQLVSGTSLTASVNCAVGDLVVAAIATRDTLSVSDGWTLVSTSGINSTDTTGNGHRLSWAYKFATSTTESITVTQATAQRLYINMVALQGATGVVDSGYSYLDNTTDTSITVAKPSGLILWGMTAPLWSQTTPYAVWTASNEMPIIQLGESTQSRLGIGLDQSSDESVTIKPGDTTAPLTVGSLTVQGMDKFYTEMPL